MNMVITMSNNQVDNEYLKYLFFVNSKTHCGAKLARKI